jgi:antitoxin component YwqK of YwqJK toxin-antitoxin module
MVKVKDPGQSNEKAPAIEKPIVKNGKFQPNGYNKVYNAQDEIWQDGDFKDGRLYNGKVYVYDRDGILLKVKVYKNGVYHSDGQL